MRRPHVLFALLASSTMAVLTQCGNETFRGNDEGTDSSVSDAGNLDVATDGGSIVDSSVTNPCIGAEHWICDTFDRGGALTDFPYWSFAATSDGGTLQILSPSGSPPPSPPNVLFAAAGSGEHAFVNATAAQGPSGLRCSVTFRIDQRSEGQSLIARLSLYTSDIAYYRVQVLGNPDDFGEYGQYSDAAPFIQDLGKHAFVDGEWNTITLEAALGDAGATLVTINGVPFGAPSAVDLTSFPPVTSLVAEVGIEDIAGDGGWSVLYDNAYCDLIP